MKFGKEFASQMVHEWEPAYMDYNHLKSLLKDVLKFRLRNAPSPSQPESRRGKIKRRMSLYRAFSGLTDHLSRKGSLKTAEDQVILVSEMQSKNAESLQGFYCQTTFLASSTDEGGEFELLFFQKLDEEFNKVLKFYEEKVAEVKAEAEELSKQMDALIALRVKVDCPLIEFVLEPPTPSPKSADLSSNGTRKGMSQMDAIQEVESSSEGILMVEEERETRRKLNTKGFKPPPLQVLNHVRINVDPETPVSTLKNVFKGAKPDLSYSKAELKKAQEKLKKAFIEFHAKLRLLKSYSFLNFLAFSKIMKKYDKVTSRNAAKSYLQMVENSSLGNSDEITRLTERVEATVVKHFSNGNHSEGMKLLRPKAKRERHRVTFFLGLFCGCIIALQVALFVSMHARGLLEKADEPERAIEREKYMDNIFPLYSLFAYIVMHMVLFAGNIYLWRRFRVNYPFIFGFKEGKQFMGYRQVLLVASGLAVMTCAAVIANLDLEMEPKTQRYKTLTELLPLTLVIVVLLIVFCPFNIVYRSSRFFFLRCSWHCICAPLYKVTLPDFFLGDQFTSQIQALRCLLFYVCYYGWGDFTRRESNCSGSRIFQIFNIVVTVIPFWYRFLQCIRRWFEGEDNVQLYNAVKYMSTIVALVLRTLFDPARVVQPLVELPLLTRQVIIGATSGFTTMFNSYWDIVMDWGLLQRDSRNPWLRDKLIVSNKKVYFAAIVVNSLLRLVWMQLVFDFQLPYLHRKVMIAVVACLEILRRCIWNFFRLENEHLNNVGKYRAFKTVPLPFFYDEEKGGD